MSRRNQRSKETSTSLKIIKNYDTDNNNGPYVANGEQENKQHKIGSSFHSMSRVATATGSRKDFSHKNIHHKSEKLL